MRNYLLPVLILITIGCSTKQNGIAFDPKSDRVIDASRKERPDWLAQDNLGFIKNGIVYRIGVAEAPADASPRKLTEIAAMKAKADLAQELRTKLENRVQYASEGLGIEQETLERIVTMGSKLENVNGLRTHETYYEKVATTDGYTESMKFISYALVGLDEKEYRRQLANAIRGNVDPSLSAKFQKKVDQNWGEFFGSETKVAESEGDPTN